MSGFGRETTTDEVLAGHDFTGLTVFVTGGNSGLGQETGRAMAARGAQVVLMGRDAAKLDAAAQTIRAAHGAARVETIVGDLGSLDRLAACGEEARERFKTIDILVNNAGVMACPFEHTADGFERQFGTNHLGHFALTAHLMPLIEAGSGKRIVNLSSRAHHMAPVDLDDLHFKRRTYHPWVSYGHAKTANVLFTVELEQRYAARGIHAYAVHPGGIETNLGRHLTEDMRAALMERVTRSDSGFAWKTIPQGAATSCWAATAPELDGHGGVYCEDCHVAEVDDHSSGGGVRSYALDQPSAAQLWRISEELTGISYPV
jgi:NAD(P)-dependent dehydrogenase (short-subunit alcohol dehydrogenase family)